jgi:hypothetical protein
MNSAAETPYNLVDLDHTLAHYTKHTEQGMKIGEPVPAMVERVQRWLHTGIDVRIFTARASRPGFVGSHEEQQIKDWCREVFGRELKIQNWKCFNCLHIWDNIAISVEPNRGWRMTSLIEDGVDPLSKNEEIKLTELAYTRTETKKR